MGRFRAKDTEIADDEIMQGLYRKLRSQEVVMQWTQVYDPLGHWWLSTLVAGLPIIVLFGLLAGLKVKPHWCAIAGAVTAVGGVNCLFQKPPPPAGIQFW